MRTLHTITVTSRPVPALRAQAPLTPEGQQPFTRVKLRHRYRAEFTAGPFKGQWVDGFPSSDEALGALVLSTAETLDSAESICQFLASLFDNCKVRGANETLGRAIRFASRNPNRQNPGLTLTFFDPANQPPKPPAPAAAEPTPPAILAAAKSEKAAKLPAVEAAEQITPAMVAAAKAAKSGKAVRA